VAQYLATTCAEDPPSPDEERTLGREALITRNTRLVVSVAKKYTGNGVPFRDLIQEGICGLIEAVDRWDPDRGRLSTYAVPWIRREIVNALKEDRAITVPRNAVDDIGRIARARHRLMQELGRNPTTDEVAKEADLEVEYIQSLQLADNIGSLDSELKGGGPLLALLGDDGVEDRVFAATITEEALGALEGDMLEWTWRHFGLEDSYRSIAADIDVSRETVRGVCLEGLELLREVTRQ